MLIAFVLCSCLWNAQWSESEIKYNLSIYSGELLEKSAQEDEGNKDKEQLEIFAPLMIVWRWGT